MSRRWLRRTLAALALLLALPALLVAEAIWALQGPDGVAFTPPPTTPQRVGSGSGEPLRFAVLGDSTAVGQGARYEQGIAVGAAEHLARRRPVALLNVGKSGARWEDVERQADRAARFKPDVVLVAAGANDVTHLTATGSVADSLRRTVATLREASPEVAIVLTGSPGVGVVPRFAQPLRWVAGRRTAQMNEAITKTADDLGATLAPVAARTSDLFAADRTLFAADDFHPSARGYATWRPVIAEALDAVTN